MKYIVILAIFFNTYHIDLYSQQLDPVTWEFQAEKSSDGEYVLHFKANIEKDWVIYGMEELEDGPIPTSINFDEGAYELQGELSTTSKSTVAEDAMFMVKLEKFKSKADFKQIVSTKEPTRITGWVTFMTCDGERCLPPKDIDFSFDLK